MRDSNINIYYNFLKSVLKTNLFLFLTGQRSEPLVPQEYFSKLDPKVLQDLIETGRIVKQQDGENFNFIYWLIKFVKDLFFN